MAYSVYMISCRDGSLYTGITNDLERRMSQHASGNGSRYVRTRRPFRLVYSEEQPDRPSALKRELEIKALKRHQKLALVRSGGSADAAFMEPRPPGKELI
jgi:putative endonuclease